MTHNDHPNQGHNHTHGGNKKALIISFILTTVYMLIEAAGGLITNSLALLSDAGHMLSDSVSLGVAVLAFIIGEKAANYSKTYGYQRFEILAALFNGAALIVIAVYIIFEAYHRFKNPPDVASTGMLIIASVGFLMNVAVAWILMKGDTKQNLNLRAAFFHVLGDLLGSIGAIAAALLIMYLGWGFADPLASVVVAVLVLISGYKVAKEAVHILMEGKPKDIEVNKIIRSLLESNQIASMHDLHIWSITSGKNALSGHVVVKDNMTFPESQQLLREIEEKLLQYNIGHVTIQLEDGDHPHKDSITCQNDGPDESDLVH